MKQSRDPKRGVLVQGRLVTWEEWHRRSGRKHKWRKGRFLKGPSGWEGQSKEAATRANRIDRHKTKQSLGP